MTLKEGTDVAYPDNDGSLILAKYLYTRSDGWLVLLTPTGKNIFRSDEAFVLKSVLDLIKDV